MVPGWTVIFSSLASPLGQLLEGVASLDHDIGPWHQTAMQWAVGTPVLASRGKE